jgi:hypothetical protein
MIQVIVSGLQLLANFIFGKNFTPISADTLPTPLNFVLVTILNIFFTRFSSGKSKLLALPFVIELSNSKSVADVTQERFYRNSKIHGV